MSMFSTQAVNYCNLPCLFRVRLVHNVQLDPSVQTLQAHPLNAPMGLTAWVLQPAA